MSTIIQPNGQNIKYKGEALMTTILAFSLRVLGGKLL